MPSIIVREDLTDISWKKGNSIWTTLVSYVCDMEIFCVCCGESELCLVGKNKTLPVQQEMLLATDVESQVMISKVLEHLQMECYALSLDF